MAYFVDILSDEFLRRIDKKQQITLKFKNFGIKYFTLKMSHYFNSPLLSYPIPRFQ